MVDTACTVLCPMLDFDVQRGIVQSTEYGVLVIDSTMEPPRKSKPYPRVRFPIDHGEIRPCQARQPLSKVQCRSLTVSGGRRRRVESADKMPHTV